MPKEKASKSNLLKQWVIGEEEFTTDGRVILCQCCDKAVVYLPVGLCFR